MSCSLGGFVFFSFFSLYKISHCMYSTRNLCTYLILFFFFCVPCFPFFFFSPVVHIHITMIRKVKNKQSILGGFGIRGGFILFFVFFFQNMHRFFLTHLKVYIYIFQSSVWIFFKGVFVFIQNITKRGWQMDKRKDREIQADR
ncbi:hypothetical protein QBC38DRAFT_190295 [Podospora fimiseda]|uniref:Uncharacterized protein n=1 Tax=Podospora fimiseda TaxID=252190 RepID=A0AAN7BQC5_9PEZI|nr:hypothetical protein QBC38DRAFT_190295 [Podospora fimiseda]